MKKQDNERKPGGVIDLANNTGAIVQGFEPEFEEVEKIANNIEDFFELIITNRIELL